METGRQRWATTCRSGDIQQGEAVSSDQREMCDLGRVGGAMPSSSSIEMADPPSRSTPSCWRSMARAWHSLPGPPDSSRSGRLRRVRIARRRVDHRSFPSTAIGEPPQHFATAISEYSQLNPGIGHQRRVIDGANDIKPGSLRCS